MNPKHRSDIRGRPRRRLARGLGWFSVGLGVAQIVAPQGVAKLIGVRPDDRNRTLMRALGLREITSGVGLLSGGRESGWLWSRVAGDVLDLALLGGAFGRGRTDARRLGVAVAAVAGVGLLDAFAATEAVGEDEGIHVVRLITIDRSPEDVYRFWREVENLPRFMSHLHVVRALDDRRSHWVACGPVGRFVEWDAEIVDDRPGERIAWRSLAGADVDNEGAVSFAPAPGDRGTEVRVELRYHPPGGALGATVAKLFRRAPDQEIADDLRRLKQVLETGQVVHSDATWRPGPHPARPPADAPSEDEVLETFQPFAGHELLASRRPPEALS